MIRATSGEAPMSFNFIKKMLQELNQNAYQKNATAIKSKRLEKNCYSNQIKTFINELLQQSNQNIFEKNCCINQIKTFIKCRIFNKQSPK